MLSSGAALIMILPTTLAQPQSIRHTKRASPQSGWLFSLTSHSGAQRSNLVHHTRQEETIGDLRLFDYRRLALVVVDDDTAAT